MAEGRVNWHPCRVGKTTSEDGLEVETNRPYAVEWALKVRRPQAIRCQPGGRTIANIEHAITQRGRQLFAT